VLIGLFNGTDFWSRYEWQVRGSGHIHGFLWSLTALEPNPSASASRAAFAEYWATFISAINPDQSRPPDLQHPSALSYKEQLNTSELLTACLNRF